MFGFIIFLVVVACIIFGPVFFFLEIFSTFIGFVFELFDSAIGILILIILLLYFLAH